ncbi:MAG: hypothetical protein KDE26_16170 [Bacteroidetes bacterium]|nr:hypothetical protein [Bacteroidota bacterium]MCB0844792.1 hypothetical protein [Bacteroidota bacterium]
MKKSLHLNLTLYIVTTCIISTALYIAFPWLIIPTVVFMGIFILSRFPGNALPEDKTATSVVSEKS